MGLFSKLFGGGSIQSSASNASFLQTYSGGSGGWGLDRFNSIIKAYSSVEGIVDEFMLDDEGCEYMSLEGYGNPYEQAYEEELEKAEEKAQILEEASGGMLSINPEELINWDMVETKARRYAVQLASAWLNGSDWIPEEVMDWAWYDLSDHNN